MFSFYYHKFMKRYWYIMLPAVVCFCLATYATLCVPYLVRYLLDVVFHEQLGEPTHSALFGVVRDLVLLYMLKGFSYAGYQTLLSRAGTRFVVLLREKLFSRILRLRLDYFDKHKQGEIVSLFINDIGLIQTALTNGLTDFLLESIGLCFLIGVMLWMSWQLTLITIIILPVIAVSTSFFKNKLNIYGGRILETQAEVTGLMQFFVNCVRMVRGFVRESYEAGRFREAQNKSLRAFLKMQKYRALLLSLSETLAMLGIVAIVLVGGGLILKKELTVGFLCAFLVYLINLPVSVKKIADAFTALRLGMVAWERIAETEEQPEDVESGRIILNEPRGQIEFCGVSFGYGSERILDDISFSVSPGEFVAVVGPSGAGKTSIATLLMRFRDVDNGGIYFDGTDIRSLNRDSYRQKLAYIQQEAFLFNDSIESNIRYGNLEATRDAVAAATGLADAAGFIEELPDGYATNAGTYGAKLSGGQRQRIALARAMLKKPKVLVLDEPTAALDKVSEQQVYGAIRQACRGVTTVLITHNYQLLDGSDRVICLDQGRIIETGTHRELLKRKGYYYYLYNMSKLAKTVAV